MAYGTGSMGEFESSASDFDSTLARCREERKWRMEAVQALTTIGREFDHGAVAENTWWEASEWTMDDSALFTEVHWDDSEGQALRYLHPFGVKRDQFNLQMSAEVHSHEEYSGHTWYMIQCSLSGGNLGGTPLLWTSPRRLCQLRGLYDYVKEHLTEYNRHFEDTQFVLPMAPPGTTARLQKWLQRLVHLLTEAKLPNSVAAAILDFFQAHRTLPAAVKSTVSADAVSEAKEAAQGHPGEALTELASEQTATSEFTVTLTKTDDQTSLGMGIDVADPSNIKVNAINNGLVGDWNTVNPHLAIQPDDVIVSINGVYGKQMLDLARSDTVLQLLVRRPGSS